MNNPKFIYKLTDQNLQTYGGFQYRLNRWVKVDCDPNEDLCSASWLHAYEHPLIAVLMNPIHAGIEIPRLFKCKWRGHIRFDIHSKLGVSEVILKQELELPIITLDQRVEIAIRCALYVYKDPNFHKWAEDWISNTNRSKKDARAAQAATWAVAEAAAEAAARAAAEAAAWAAARSARDAAWAAARAADWAAEAAADAADAAEAAEAAEAAAWDAADAAEAADWAADWAAEIPLLDIIQEVVNA